MLSEPAKVATRREWRSLGFFYDRDDDRREWRIVGSSQGLQRFAALLRDFAANPANQAVSEHEHFGPYLYLEVGTWPSAEITDHWIAGPLGSLRELASIVEGRAQQLSVGESVSLRGEFAPDSPYDLRIEIRPDDFDPAWEDPNCAELPG